MNTTLPHFSDLFAQLGLPNDDQSIARFLARHTPLPAGNRLPDATFWTPAQATFLRESLSQDSDWSGVVDQLGEALQGATEPKP